MHAQIFQAVPIFFFFSQAFMWLRCLQAAVLVFPHVLASTGCYLATLKGGYCAVLSSAFFCFQSRIWSLPQIYRPRRIPPLWIAASCVGLFISCYWSAGLFYILGTDPLFVLCVANIFSCWLLCVFQLFFGIFLFFFGKTLQRLSFHRTWILWEVYICICWELRI